MPDCELCGKHVLRRRRICNGHLVCWSCFYREKWSKIELIRKINSLEKMNDDLSSKIPPRISEIEYRFNSPFSAIPPKDVLKNAFIGLNLGGYFSDFSQVLGDYYGINAPRYYADDNKVTEGAIACYYPSSNEVYSFKKEPLLHETAFHEFYHALQNFGIVPKKDSEKNADLYAKGCMKRLKEA